MKRKLLKRRSHTRVDAFEMDDGTVFVQSSKDRIPERYVRASDISAVLARRLADEVSGQLGRQVARY